METINQMLMEFLGFNHKMTIPIYQRRYSWKEKQCIYPFINANFFINIPKMNLLFIFSFKFIL